LEAWINSILLVMNLLILLRLFFALCKRSLVSALWSLRQIAPCFWEDRIAQVPLERMPAPCAMTY